MQDRDLRVVCNAIQSLREICNEIVEPRPVAVPGSGSGRWLPDWCYLDKRQPALWSSIQHYRPLDNISLDQINLVFLSQEMTTTGGVSFVLVDGLTVRHPTPYHVMEY